MCSDFFDIAQKRSQQRDQRRVGTDYTLPEAIHVEKPAGRISLPPAYLCERLVNLYSGSRCELGLDGFLECLERLRANDGLVDGHLAIRADDADEERRRTGDSPVISFG